LYEEEEDMKRSLAIISLLIMLCLASTVWAVQTVYIRTALIGGGATALDGIDGAGLLDKDMAFVTVSGTLYIYWLDADSAVTDDGLNYIAPDANGGDKRWVLQSISGPKTTVGTSRTTATNAEYVICTNTCTVQPKVPAIGDQLCVRNAPGVVTVITLSAVADIAYEKKDYSGWHTANKSMTSAGSVSDKICLVGYSATQWAIMSQAGTWTNTP